MTVLSFDLVSDGAYVVEADICGTLPLPGSEEVEANLGGEGQIADVVVCALSLMGTNWPNCIREAWRVLKLGYVAQPKFDGLSAYSPIQVVNLKSQKLPVGLKTWTSSSRSSVRSVSNLYQR
jgi:Hypothetical methyltransferase